jgi:outer membrane protein OmpA-like peptidoglycan-associated protein
MRVVYGLVFFISAVTLSAQSVPQLLKIADELYEVGRFIEATEFYEKITKLDKRNHFAKYRLATCYKLTLQHQKARGVFLQLGGIAGQEYQKRSIFEYASLLKLNGEFKEADSVFTELISMTGTSSELINLSRKQREGCLLALREQNLNRGFQVILHKEINSPFHDFGAVINPANKHLVFATTRNVRGEQYEGGQYQGLLPDLVSFQAQSNGKFKNTSNLQDFSKLNTHWAEGAGNFTADGTSFYFSTCNGDGTDCVIQVSQLTNGKWSLGTPLNEYINEKGFDSKHPFITSNGDTLFFSSNRTGGMGGADIWMSLKGEKEGSWTPAINMGDAINTPGDEITPYYSAAFNCLLFASNGHVDYGGYDLFAAKGESFFDRQIYNLGAPFNSTHDDTYFHIADSVGFLASNRIDGEILEIYYFPVKDERLFLSLLLSGELLIDAKIISRFRDVGSLDLTAFRVEDYAGYEVFDPVKRDKKRPSILDSQPTNSFPQNSDGGVFENLHFDFGIASLRSETKVALDDLILALKGKDNYKLNILAYTDYLGSDSFNINLCKRRGEAVRRYLIKNGVPNQNMHVASRGELPKDDEDSWFNRILSRRVEIVIEADEPIAVPVAKTLILRKENTLAGIAEGLGYSQQDIVKWNGTIKGVIGAGSTIRVFEPLSLPLDTEYFLDRASIKQIFNTPSQ